MTLFSEIVGNSIAKQSLEKLLSKNRVPHLLLFAGPDGIGKKLFAIEFAFAALQIPKDTHHPDITIFSPEGKTGMHSAQAVKDMIEKISLQPYVAKKKVCIIEDAERMLPASSQALLKTLEEPPINTLIILLSSQPEKLLETIRSRTQLVRFQPLQHEELQKFLQEKYSIDAAPRMLALGTVTAALRIATQDYADLLQKLDDLFESTPFSFSQIAFFAKEAQSYFDEKKEAWKKELTKFHETLLKEGSSQQKLRIEQEIDGTVQMRFLQEVDLLLQHIYTASQKLCFDIDQPHVLADLEENLIFSKQLLERQTPLSQVLESFFLKLTSQEHTPV